MVVGSAQVIRQGGNVIQVYMTVAIVSGPEGRMFHICAEVSVFCRHFIVAIDQIHKHIGT